ncbi:methyltransferase domain-containing protein [Halegenticoccus tardaugens]|uniref:methyltransferase domain-containing protein n=1 Tax=Halegenticoccus tardaugens TaxID=2071624 RepID=UPI00100C0271|nr:methyltransferase domain-containing protein [Halegenticoccus tardaugens]
MADDDSAGDRYRIDDFAFIGRIFEEYRRMFDLDPDRVAGIRVLDCPGGACSFIAETAARSGEAVAVDALYGPPPDDLATRCERDVERAVDALSGVEHLYEWGYYGDVGTLESHRRTAAERFLADYADSPSRYVRAALPDLPFPDDSFDLVLSAHLLFLYDDRLDHAFHRDALRELARVAAGELRVFPLVGFDAAEYGRLDDLRRTLEADGYATERRPVPFEFQRGATETLVVSR